MDLAIRRLEEAVRRLGEATAGRERRGLRHDDADDVTGTVATDDAIGFNPLPLLRALHDHGAVIRMRRAVGRPKDLRRASELEQLGDRGPHSGPA